MFKESQRKTGNWDQISLISLFIVEHPEHFWSKVILVSLSCAKLSSSFVLSKYCPNTDHTSLIDKQTETAKPQYLQLIYSKNKAIFIVALVSFTVLLFSQ